MGTYFYTVKVAPKKVESYFSSIDSTNGITSVEESTRPYQSTLKVNEQMEIEKYITGNVIWGNKLDSTSSEMIHTTEKINTKTQYFTKTLRNEIDGDLVEDITKIPG